MRPMTARELLDRLDLARLAEQADKLDELLTREGWDSPAIAACGALLAGAAAAAVSPEVRDGFLMGLADIADRYEQTMRRKVDELEADIAIAAAPPEYMREVEAAIVRAYRQGEP